jgi:metallo-beta-lactamase family protein
MVISSSGMMEGGRILHHLQHGISDPKNTLLITGYQAENTLGRRIRSGENPVKILGAMQNVSARVITMNEFSAHADQTYLATYIKSLHGLKNLFLVHTELPQAKSLEQLLAADHPNFQIIIPELLSSFDV